MQVQHGLKLYRQVEKLPTKMAKNSNVKPAKNGQVGKSKSKAVTAKKAPSKKTNEKEKNAWRTFMESPAAPVVSSIVLVLAGVFGIWLVFFREADTQLAGFQPFLHQDEEEGVVEEPEEPEEPSIYRTIDGQPSDRELNPQPFAVMIENLTVVRPQSGLSFAPVVYETLAEGGITRFMAIFSDEDLEKIGPVRSARPYYLEWSSEYDAVYAHAGGSPQALEAISGLGIDSLNAISGEGRFFYRDSSRYAPHNLFTTTELLALAIRDKGLEEKVVDFESWKFKDDAALEERATPGSGIRIGWSSPAYQSSYSYDREQNVYLRNNGGGAHTDALTGNQIAVKNVVVLRIPEEQAAGEKGRIFLDVTGEGEAWILRDGFVIQGTWNKEDREGRTRFYTEAGEEIELNRGNTWIHVVPGDRPIELQ